MPEIHQPEQYSSLAAADKRVHHMCCADSCMVVQTSALVLRVNAALVLHLADRPP